MARGRSKSIVQKIAADVPEYEDDTLGVGEPRNRASETRNGSSIVESPNGTKNGTDGLLKALRGRAKSLEGPPSMSRKPTSHDTPLFPFSPAEAERLWASHIDRTYNHNLILSDANISAINDLSQDFILNFQKNCDINTEYLDQLILENDTILDSLNSLVVQYDKISRETRDFAQSSTALINDQTKYEAIVNDINDVLMIFEPLDSITKKLSNPGNHLIKSKNFKDILQKLDASLVFLENHKDYKEYEFYKIKFRQCLTRSFSLIRNYLTEDLKRLNTRITSKYASQKDATAISLDLLLYGEFLDYAGVDEKGQFPEHQYRFPDLVSEIISRIDNHQEYTGLVNDVLGQYFRTRLVLLNAHIIQPHHQQLQQQTVTKDLVQTCQNNISFYKKLIEREFSLFKRFFSYDSLNRLEKSYLKDEVHNYFRQLIDPLYDELRNKVIRETNISSLCRLTNLLQKYYEFEDFEDGGSVVSAPSVLASFSAGVDSAESINFGELFEPILNDVQSRLVFRVQIYIDDKLSKYKPRPDDLMIGNRRRKSSTANKDSKPEAKSSVNLDADFEENLFPDLYPPLGKALTILSNIYELINSVVFDDLAHYIVHSCIDILKTNAYKLALVHLGKMDAQLYYLQNLIILKNQLNNFDIQFVRTETTLDFTSGINEIIETFKNGNFMYNVNKKGGIFEMVSKTVPKVINNMIDAKYEIELELVNSVNEFLSACVNTISEPILKLTTSLEDQKTTDIKLMESTTAFKDNLIIQIPKVASQIRIFISDATILRYLMDNLSNLIVSTYDIFYKSLEEKLDNGNAEDTIKMKEEFDEVMESDTLHGFINELVSNVYENEEHAADVTTEFNESILDEFQD